MKYLNKIINTVAQRLNDKDFEDFSFEDYVSQYQSASVELAKKYQVFIKGYQFKAGDATDDMQADIILDIPDFKNEVDVFVNDIQLLKVSRQIVPIYDFVYYLEKIDNELFFNYILKGTTLPEKNTFVYYDSDNKDEFTRMTTSYKKNPNDEIYIVYEAIPDAEGILNSYYIFPEVYREELIKTLLVSISELGMIKFAASEKAIKYKSAYSLFKQDITKVDTKTAKFKDFIIIKPWGVI